MLWLALALAAAPAPVERGLVLDPVVVGDVSDADRVAVGERVAFAIASNARFKVISKDEMTALANLAAEKQAAGCDEDACMTEIADALDARFVVRPRLSHTRDVLLTIVVFDAKSNSVAGRGQVEAASVDALSDVIDGAVADALDEAGELKKRRVKKPTAGRGPGALTIAGGVGLGVAGVGVVGGLIGLGAAELALSSPSTLTSTDVGNWRAIGRLSAIVGGGVAVVAGATGGALFALGATE